MRMTCRTRWRPAAAILRTKFALGTRCCLIGGLDSLRNCKRRGQASYGLVQAVRQQRWATLICDGRCCARVHFQPLRSAAARQTRQALITNNISNPPSPAPGGHGFTTNHERRPSVRARRMGGWHRSSHGMVLPVLK